MDYSEEVASLHDLVMAVNIAALRPKDQILQELITITKPFNYNVVDVDMTKPWGGFVRFATNNADHFITNFFPGLTAGQARNGLNDVELSPKFLLVSPNQRLSWQRHQRRAERWACLTPVGYHKSDSPSDMGELHVMQSGDVVQFNNGDCHRLVGLAGSSYGLVAEIWQHTDPANPSDEADIERLQDDYNR